MRLLDGGLTRLLLRLQALLLGGFLLVTLVRLLSGALFGSRPGRLRSLLVLRFLPLPAFRFLLLLQAGLVGFLPLPLFRGFALLLRLSLRLSPAGAPALRLLPFLGFGFFPGLLLRLFLLVEFGLFAGFLVGLRLLGLFLLLPGYLLGSGLFRLFLLLAFGFLLAFFGFGPLLLICFLRGLLLGGFRCLLVGLLAGFLFFLQAGLVGGLRVLLGLSFGLAGLPLLGLGLLLLDPGLFFGLRLLVFGFRLFLLFAFLLGLARFFLGLALQLGFRFLGFGALLILALDLVLLVGLFLVPRLGLLALLLVGCLAAFRLVLARLDLLTLLLFALLALLFGRLLLVALLSLLPGAVFRFRSFARSLLLLRPPLAPGVPFLAAAPGGPGRLPPALAAPRLRGPAPPVAPLLAARAARPRFLPGLAAPPVPALRVRPVPGFPGRPGACCCSAWSCSWAFLVGEGLSFRLFLLLAFGFLLAFFGFGPLVLIGLFRGLLLGLMIELAAQGNGPAAGVLRARDLAGEPLPARCGRAGDAQRPARAGHRAIHAGHRQRARPARSLRSGAGAAEIRGVSERAAQPVRQSRAGGGRLQCRTAAGAGMARRHRGDAAGDAQLRVSPSPARRVEDWAKARQERQAAASARRPRAAAN